MAEHLAKIFGTEEDKVNCSFYLKIGACRHGDRCSRSHVRPSFSPTILVPHMYAPPPPDYKTGTVSDDTQHFAEFYEEVCLVFFKAITDYGRIGQIRADRESGGFREPR